VDVRFPTGPILNIKPSSRKEVFPRMFHTMPTGFPPRTLWLCNCLLGATAALLQPSPAESAEFNALAPPSITADDAARHVVALADDAFEGREGGTRGGRAAATYIVDQIESLGYEPAGSEGSYYQSFGNGLRNILALLPGSDPHLAAEVVVVGGHYDHVGYGTERNSFGPVGLIHNGADDNASGVAGLIELMKAVRQLAQAPRRSILFAFWDGEEKDLLGSRHFLRVPPPLLVGNRVVFSLNLDMIGRLREQRLTVFGIRTATGLRSLLVAANNQPDRGRRLELAFDWEVADDSDHYPFIAAGIPTLMLHTGLHDQYHRPSDDVEHVNFAGIPLVTRLALAVIASVADEDIPPTFRPAAQSESIATRRRFEEYRPSSRPPVGRWGIISRSDPAEPTLPIVIKVVQDSPAARAGLKAGDRLSAVAGTHNADQAAMIQALAAAGPECRIEVDRRGILEQLQLQETQPTMDAR
jgi:Zn-dependent M28 family amino/carboxypeptidase